MVLPMNEREFLLAEHERIRSSGQIFWPEWRSDFERFYEDLLAMTPKWIGARYLGPREKALGIVPGNVEWHFKKHHVDEKTVPKPKAKSGKRRSVPKAISALEKQKLMEAAKEERRTKLAAEFRRWEEMRCKGENAPPAKSQIPSRLKAHPDVQKNRVPKIEDSEATRQAKTG
jgi:hypothetical protein